MSDDDVKWIGPMITRFCPGCQRRTMHDRGVKMVKSKQVLVVECCKCHEEVEVGQ